MVKSMEGFSWELDTVKKLSNIIKNSLLEGIKDKLLYFRNIMHLHHEDQL